jgi:LDH2 family malate/lactate/ureidoglycolate dehydrogenase
VTVPSRSSQDLLEILSALYIAVGVPEDEARIVADHQVDANLVGHDSHGVLLTADYVARIERGHIVPGAALETVHETPSTLVVDGHWGFGFVVTDRVTQMVRDRAAEHGIAAATVRRQGHVGRLGAYAAALAASGAIGLVTADSGKGPKSVAPFGGRDRRLGTNPLSIGVPSDLPGPVVLDMATSAVAVGKVKLARAAGTQLRSRAVIDRQGRPTTDPAAYFDGGALLPLGGDEGHKGYGLSFMVEVLSGLLTGIGFGTDPDGIHNDGVVVLAMDVERFRDLRAFKDDVHDFVSFLKESPPADGFDEVLYPGELEHRTRARRLEEGIPIEDTTWRSIVELGERCGIVI